MMVYFKVVDGMDRTWFAVIGDGIGVYTTRETGKWQPDDTVGAEDLIMPEQEHAEWDVTEVEESDLPKPVPRE